MSHAALTSNAATRIFKSLPALRARPVKCGDLPAAAQLRRAIDSDWEIPKHFRHDLSCWFPKEIRRRKLHAWLRGALGAFGIESGYFIALGAEGSPWWRIEPEDPLDWLATLARSRDVHAPKGKRSPVRSRYHDIWQPVTVLSSDGARALLFHRKRDDERHVHLFSLHTEILVHRAVSSERMDALVKGMPGLHAFRIGGGGPSIFAEAMRPSNRCVTRWSSGPLREERERLLLDGLAALSATVPTSGDEELRDCYALSIGAFGPLAWIVVKVQAEPRWIVSLWESGGLDRLFAFALTGDHVFGCLASERGCEGFLVPINEVRAA